MWSFLKMLRNVLAGLVTVFVLLFLGAWGYSIWDRPHYVAEILKIESIPKSAKVADCDSWGFTDVLVTCALTIAPKDFDQLLLGYPFNYSKDQRSSHSLGGPDVGEEFEAVHVYGVWPSEFVHGGAVHVYANASKDKVIVDLYIE